MKSLVILFFAISTAFAADDQPWKPIVEFHENYMVARAYAWAPGDNPMADKPGIGSGVPTYIRYDAIDTVTREFYSDNGTCVYFILITCGGDTTKAGFKVGSKEDFDKMWRYFGGTQDSDVVEKAFGK